MRSVVVTLLYYEDSICLGPFIYIFQAPVSTDIPATTSMCSMVFLRVNLVQQFPLWILLHLFQQRTSENTGMGRFIDHMSLLPGHRDIILCDTMICF